MRIAVVGCLHGQIDSVYAALPSGTDLLLICGDVQAVRDVGDLKSMAVPVKYRNMGQFAPYYELKKTAPVLTVVIGGNHEASKHMAPLWLGGWLAPRIYYLGDAGVIDVGGCKIGGISGIWFERDYELPHFEREHYSHLSDSMIRSIYHTRREDVTRLIKFGKGIDIFLSHDWPRDIAHFGDLKHLLTIKPWFEEDIRSRKLGSPALLDIMKITSPSRWFSAHMHCFYKARFGSTRFVALDKVLPSRKFMQVFKFPGKSGPLVLDPRWLGILRDSETALTPFEIPEFGPPDVQTSQFIERLNLAKPLM